MTKTEAENTFASGTPFEISEALISSVLHSDDREWAEAWVVRLMGYADIGVRKTSAVALGHLARLHGEVSAVARDAVRGLIGDRRTAGAAADCLSDIEIFCRKS